MVEGTALEMRRTCKRTVGSNPTPSATQKIRSKIFNGLDANLANRTSKFVERAAAAKQGNKKSSGQWRAIARECRGFKKPPNTPGPVRPCVRQQRSEFDHTEANSPNATSGRSSKPAAARPARL